MCSHRFLATTSSGVVMHRSRFGEPVLPKAFSSPDASYDGFYSDDSIARARGTCVEYCPFSPGAFLVGFGDGKIG